MTCHRWFVPRWAALCLLLTALGAERASATPNEIDMPDTLRPWIDWVLHDQPQVVCPAVDGQAICLWPGVLRIDADLEGGAFSLRLVADRDELVPLPGDEARWPQSVRVDGREAPVVLSHGQPAVEVEAGVHTVTGAIPWNDVPESLALPGSVALLDLIVRGEQVEHPRVEDGTLWLQASGDRVAEESRLDLDVFRRIDDRVPVMVTTRIDLRVAGKAREVDLGPVLLPDTIPVSVTSSIPARLDDQGNLVVQVLSGTWTVEVVGRTEAPVQTLTAPARQRPWPETETWIFVANEQLRTVNLTGAPGVDPARTALPDEWRGFPAYLLESGGAIRFEEIRRGEPEPPPDQLSLQRDIWLDGSGRSLTIRDRFSGTIHAGWRLNMEQPAELGHASTPAGDVLVTSDEDGRSGVELRQQSLSLEADSRIGDRRGAIPAVGWDHDVQSLSANLHLPPGWALLAGVGVDELPGSWIERWTLLDLFFLLIIVLVVGKLAGWRWGVLALAGVGLAFQADGAPALVWLALLATLALQRVLGEGKLRIPILILRGLAAIVVAAFLLPFLVSEVRYAFFPASEEAITYLDEYDWGIPDRYAAVDFEDSKAWEGEAPAPQADMPVDADEIVQVQGADRKKGGKGREQSSRGAYTDSSWTMSSLAIQQNALEVVQTGAGIPDWMWRTQSLVWSGPVSSDHRIRLVLAGPRAHGGLRIARVLMMILLALRLGLGRRWRRRMGLGGAKGSAAATAAVTVLMIAGLPAFPAVAAGGETAIPDAPTLAELKKRLIAPPECRPSCVSASNLDLAIDGDRLSLAAEVHVAEPSAWPIPGPVSAWVSRQVRVDGQITTALARRTDGYLMVRLEPGVHRVVAEGPVPAEDALVLQFGLLPHRVTWVGEGWIIDGLREDGTVGSSVQLARLVGDGQSATDGIGGGTLPPWLEVTRQLQIGMPWKVTTTVSRVGASSAPVILHVPLLPGESVTDETVRVEEDGVVLVSMGRDDRTIRWNSSLQETDSLTLTAPEGVPWTEVWSIAASPIWAFEAEGIPPVSHVNNGQWWPHWKPWPGESLTATFRRPAGVEGQSVTVDRAELRVQPGIRMSKSTLSMTVRTSRGGQQELTLPEGATLQTVTIDGRPYPVKAETSQVLLPLQPGRQELLLTWQRPMGMSVLLRGPKVDLGSAAVNARVILDLPSNRWIVAAGGPGWSPAVLWLVHVAWILVVALLLGRIRSTPLKTYHWFLLGLGMTQVPTVLPLLVVGWLVLLGYRRSHPPASPALHNLLQVGVLVATLVALVVLYASVHTGLLMQPDMQITGQGSWGTTLQWYLDRIDGAMPRPWVLSFPMWIWRVLMLLWALWLAYSLVQWLRWGYQAFIEGGILRSMALPPKEAAAAAAGGATAEAEEPPEAPSSDPEGS